jgi:pimeloyl-ACP methyl ester carboxylesterase
MNATMKTLAALLAACTFAAPALAANPAAAGTKNIVIVPGEFIDASGWHVVHDILSQKGYHVTVVPAAHTTFEDDVALARRVLVQQFGNVVLVGNGIGGAVIGTVGNGAKVKALVYVAAIAPEVGESPLQLLRGPDGMPAPIKADFAGYHWADRARFHDDFAADLTPNRANFLAASQTPVGLAFLGTQSYAAVWHTKPSYAVVATEDRVLAPDAQRMMYRRAKAQIVEIKGSHAVHMSRPEDVAQVIERAARDTL